MNASFHPILIVCSTNTQPPAWLVKWALQTRAIFISRRDVREVLPDVLRSRSRLVLVALDSSQKSECTNLISELHRRRPGIVVAGVALHHEESLERAARSAGAKVYIGGEADLTVLQELADVVGAPPAKRPRLLGRHRIRGRPPPKAAR